MKHFDVLIKSKAFWGAVAYGIASIVVDHSVEGIVKAIGAVVSAAGLRTAIAKNGTGE